MKRAGSIGFWIFALLHAVSAVAASGPQPAVTGTVLGQDGRPLAGARAELRPVPPGYEEGRRVIEGKSDPAPAATAETDAAGRFALRAPEPGIWRVTLRSAGTVPLQSAPLPLADPLELPPAVLPADAGAPLQVTDAAGQPLPDARIVASGDTGEGDWRPELRTGKTDAQGRLRLPRRDGETLVVSVFAPGRGEVARGGFGGGTIRVPEGGAWQAVKVTGRDGEPVPEVLVRIGGHAWPYGRTDSGGRLRVPVPTRLQWLTGDGRLAIVQMPAPAGAAEEKTVVLGDPLPLSGRLLDAGTRKPLAGALVWTAGDPGAFTRADAEGRFRINAPGRRAFEIAAIAPGYLPKRVQISVPQLTGGKAATLALTRAATVPGKVVDPSGKPLSGVTVVAAVALGARAFDPGDAVADRAVTDARGRFELRRLRPESDVEVRASRAGAFPAAQRVTLGDAAAPPREVTLVLAPARAARGKVQDPAGRPVAGAEAILRPSLRPVVSGRPSPPAEPGEGDLVVRSDAQGVFQAAEAPAAEVEVVVRKPGFAPVTLPAIRIPAGTGPADLGVVTLRPGALLAGRVLSPRDEGVAGAEVFTLDRPPGVNDVDRYLQGRKPAATTAADGRFRIEDLGAGVPVHVMVRAPGYLTARVRAVRPPAAKPLTVRLEPEAALRGRVVDEEDRPVAGARIGLRWQAHLPEDPEMRVGEPLLKSARTEADGRFEVRGVPPGEVRLGASAPGFVSSEEIVTRLPRADELRIAIQRGAVLQGRVTTAEGEPVPAVRVGAGDASATTDDDGLYWLEGAATGRREILFLHASYGRLAKELDVQPGVNVLDVAFDPGVEVTGRAVDDAGQPVAGARVQLAAVERFTLKQYQDVTGEDGRFRLPLVAGGRYRLRAEAEGFSDSELPAVIEIANQPVSNLEIALDRGATLSGRILGLAAEDLPQVEIAAYGDGGVTLPAWTDGRGRYEIRSLRPGDWTVRARLWDDQRRAQARLTIARSDREVTRDVEFAKRLTLSAQVLYDEEPLPDAKITLRGHRFAAERVTTTDYEGRFQVTDLEADTYRFGLTHPASMVAHNDQIDLQQDRDVVIRLQGSTVGGLVAAKADGRPIPGALLMMRPVQGAEFLITASSREDGRFGMYRVPPGRYTLEARAGGYTGVTQEVQVAGGQSLESLEFRLEAAQGAKLQIRLASGQTPRIVHARLRNPATGQEIGQTYNADSSGTVSFSTLPAGIWELTARPEGGAVATAALTVPSEQPLALTVPSAGRLRVRVPALVTSELNAAVRLAGADQKPFWTLGPGGVPEQRWPVVGGNGFVEGVPAGVWTVYAETPDGQTWTGTVTASGQGEEGVTLE